MNFCGITERGDPCFARDFESRLQAANIIITKNISGISDILLRNKHRCILHATITGHGSFKIEPNVPTMQKSFEYLRNLVNHGFPKEQLVLRVDPIIPNEHGLLVAKTVIISNLELIGIKRLRFSYVDMYPHVKKRYKEAGIKLPVFVDTAPFEKWLENLKYFDSIEACAENSKFRAPCISKKDLEILGVEIELQGSAGQRKLCGCPANKFELLKGKTRCPHKCLYCYWHDAEESPDPFELFEL